MTEERWDEMHRKLEEALNSMTEEDWQKYFPKDNRPKGWLSIEDHLPYCDALDYFSGGTVIKVRNTSGEEFESKVIDHNIWYYRMKELGVTHWYNKENGVIE